MRKVFKEILVYMQGKVGQRKLFSRAIDIPMNLPQITVITGPRRCGKTSLLYLAAKQLIDSGTDKEDILFVNFEDERILQESSSLDELLQAWRELYPERNLEKAHLFFDEIQVMPNWQKFVARVYENYTRNIYLSGSNSKLLSREIATELRGRSYSVELFTLGFQELLHAKKITGNKYDTDFRAVLKNKFSHYLKQGGYPGNLELPPQANLKILQEHFNTMMYRDLVERYAIGSPNALKYLLKRVYANIGKPTSVNKIFHEMKSAGFKVSKNSLYEWLEMAEAVYLFQRCNKLQASANKNLTASTKYYAIDHGLMSAMNFKYSGNYGLLLENLVYQHLRSHTREISYYKGKGECDFVRHESDEPVQALQVCYRMEEPDTREREIRGLVEACKFLELKQGTIVTLEEDETFERDGVEIRVLPYYWQYDELMEEKS